MSLDTHLVVRRKDFTLDISLSAEPGEVVALLGPNGAGKTTALRALAGLIGLDDGHITLDYVRLDRMPTEKRRIGVVFQDYLLFPHLSALDNVAFGPRCRRVPRRLAREQASELLTRMGLAEHVRKKPRQLSGGQAQRVALARALAAEPRLLLLDEPHAGLDLPSRERLVDALGRLGDERPGLPTVTVTHHVEEIPVSATHALLLRDGRVLATGPVAGVLTSEHVSACFGLPVRIGRSEGRWSATLAARPPELRTLAGASPEP
jgi:molybdate transport system ATP-binding protein